MKKAVKPYSEKNVFILINKKNNKQGFKQLISWIIHNINLGRNFQITD